VSLEAKHSNRAGEGLSGGGRDKNSVQSLQATLGKTED